MSAEDTHYEVLGVSENASTAEIEAAVAQLAHVASALALTAPAQADALWLRIRQISRDLLSGDESRRAYDQSVRAAASRAPKSQAIPELSMMPAAASAARPQPAMASTSGRGSRWRRSRRRAGAGLGAALAGIAAILLLVLQPWTGGGRPQPVAPALAFPAGGAQQGAAYRSGDLVQLRWTSAGRGAIYRLQIGRGLTLADRSTAFTFPWRDLLTERTTYSFRAVGALFYFWRVRARTAVLWGPWSPVSLFAVEAPQISVPSPSSGRSGTVVHPGATRLCWAPVPDAVRYQVRVDGRRALGTRATCITVRLAAGTHRWQVAAAVQGARIYTGPFSPSATIRAVAVHHRAVRPRRVAAAQRPSHRRRGAGRSQSGPIVVAPPTSVAIVYVPREGASSSHQPGRRASTRHASARHRAANPRAHRSRKRQRRGLPVTIPAPPRLPASHHAPSGTRTQPGFPSPAAPPGPPPPPPPPAPRSAPTSAPDRGYVPAAPPTATPEANHIWVVPPTPAH